MPVSNYFWDMENDNVLMEKDDADATTAVYTNEPGLYGKLISQHRDGETYFHHYDGGGDTRVVTDENENVVETATYSAFGEVVEKTNSIVNPFGYKGAFGYYTNGEISDIYVRARSYEPKIGRWLSRDPIGFEGSQWNVYEYADGAPTFRTDPSGFGCFIKYKCVVFGSTNVGWGGIECVYKCTEISRRTTGGIGGGLDIINCDAIPQPHVIFTSNTGVATWGGFGRCKCKDFEKGEHYTHTDDNILIDQNCSKRQCRKGCEDSDIGMVCGAIKHPAGKLACNQAFALGVDLCKNWCQATCLKP